jgi:hypothetical protein
LHPDTVRALCWPPIRNDGAVDTLSLLEFQKWGVAGGHQIRTLSDREYNDPELARNAAAELDKKR